METELSNAMWQSPGPGGCGLILCWHQESSAGPASQAASFQGTRRQSVCWQASPTSSTEEGSWEKTNPSVPLKHPFVLFILYWWKNNETVWYLNFYDLVWLSQQIVLVPTWIWDRKGTSYYFGSQCPQFVLHLQPLYVGDVLSTEGLEKNWFKPFLRACWKSILKALILCIFFKSAPSLQRT